jgi:hypothetical protein
VNKQYGCDYYVHAYNKTSEPSGRSGKGGPIHAEDIFLLEDELQMVYHHSTTDGSTSDSNNSNVIPKLHVVFDTDDDFETSRSTELKRMIDEWPDDKPNPYMMSKFDSGTLRNVLKMWHSQDRVWKLMQDGWSERKKTTTMTATDYDNDHYDRVMMLRLDVVYVTPIDIWKSRHDYDVQTFRTDGRGHLRRNMKAADDRNDPYYIDHENLSALIPGFALYPVNDRMISGPYDAVKVWASERFDRAEAHVTETVVVAVDHPDNSSQNNQTTSTTTTVIQPKVPFGKGLHDELFVARTVLPAIKNEYNITVHVDPDLWFMRVRADSSIWILDTPNLNRFKTKLGDPALESERQRLENVFRTYYDKRRQYHPDSPSYNGRRYCDDVYEVRTKGVSSAARFQIKCPPPAPI